MAFDRDLKGLLYAEGGKADAAKKEYDAGLKLVQQSDLPQQVKDNQELVYHYNMSRVALTRKDFVGSPERGGSLPAGRRSIEESGHGPERT